MDHHKRAEETREMIKECDTWTRDANMRALRTTGWRRSINLWFARLASRLGDWGREIERDEMRGPDDNYHDEY